MLGAIGGAFGVLFLVGSIPISTLADRHPRTLIAGVSMAIWSVVVFAHRARADRLLAVPRPPRRRRQPELRASAGATRRCSPTATRSRRGPGSSPSTAGSKSVGRTAGPLIAGGIAGAIAGPESWRWAFWVIAFAGVPVAIATLLLKEPQTGPQRDAAPCSATELDEDERELPVSVERGVRTAAQDPDASTTSSRHGGARLRPLQRPAVPQPLPGRHVRAVGVAAGRLRFARRAARHRRAGHRRPSAPTRCSAAAHRRRSCFAGSLIALFGVFVVVGLFMPNVWLLGCVLALGTALAQAAFMLDRGRSWQRGRAVPACASRGTRWSASTSSCSAASSARCSTGHAGDAFGRRGRARPLVVLPSDADRRRADRLRRPATSAATSRCASRSCSRRRPRPIGSAQPDAVVAALQVRNLDFSLRHRAGAVRRRPRRAPG